MVTYGGVDNKRCSETIQYVPLANLYTWEFYVDAVEVGSYSRAKRDVATPATGSGWTGVRNEVFSGIVKQTKAVYDFTNGIYTVPCSSMGTLPDIFIVIHGITYAIKSEEYVLDLNLKNGQCALAFFGTTHDPAWIFGDAFLRSYCHVLDFGKRRIGLAKSIHGKY
ncbi:hypothetical protein CAEBREN_19058 [Caenorhabditis brenneri]|uniref:Peptidase A1 domain-containing protein n=1 Tax=Caenorhabditis brenneri TaxID=135651 RepID=G0P670_CAEBE|nr:hypothetical protein CAEBREN_19058 [Caenorhabditis brenneri]